MGNFQTLNGVVELFRSVNFIGTNNCFFYALTNRDNSTSSVFGSVVGGAIGGAIAGAINFSKSSEVNEFDGYLINQTESGIGLIPLTNNNRMFMKIEDMNVHLDKFIFISNEAIEKITVKRLNLISAVSKTVIIKLKNGVKFNLTVQNKMKNIEYHESNFAQFVARYK